MMNESDDVSLQATSHPDVFHRYRNVVLSKGDSGYGFVLRGAKADKSIENFSATARHPGLQYLESVEVGSNAYRVGLRGGDFIIKINAIDVTCMGHKQTVDVIRRLRDPIRLRVVTVIVKPSGSKESNLNSSSTSSMMTSLSSKSQEEEKLHRTASVGSAIGKLDSVIALEDAFDDNENGTATLRRRPISRKFRSEDIDEMFRNTDPPIRKNSSKADQRALRGSVSSLNRLIRVLPPTVPGTTSANSDSVAQNDAGYVNQTPPQDYYTPPPSQIHQQVQGHHPPSSYSHHPPPTSYSKPTNSGTGEARKVPPMPPTRKDSQLTSSEPSSAGPKSVPMSPQTPVVAQSLGRTFKAPVTARADLTGFAAAVAAQAQQRQDRFSSSEGPDKIASVPITHRLVAKPPPTVAPKPERGKSNAPFSQAATNEEPKSAFALALAAKQANLRQRSNTVPASSGPMTAPPPVNTKPTRASASSVQKPTDEEMRELMQLPPPPPIPTNDPHSPLFYNLPPPPPPVAQPEKVSNFDPTLLPPPPETIMPARISPPAGYASASREYKNQEPHAGFTSSKFNDRFASSTNGHDSGSSADSGVEEFISQHRHQDSKPNADNLSVVSSLSTISSEDGSDAGVSLSYDPKSTQDQPTGNMYLDVLKKKRSQSAANPSTVSLTKISFNSKTQAAPEPKASVPKPEPIKTFASAPAPVVKKPVDAPKTDNATSKPLAEWTVDDVCKWLADLGLSSYAQVFAENEIVGSHLPDLSKEDLQELGVIRVGHRLTIERSLKKLTSG